MTDQLTFKEMLHCLKDIDGHMKRAVAILEKMQRDTQLETIRGRV